MILNKNLFKYIYIILKNQKLMMLFPSINDH